MGVSQQFLSQAWVRGLAWDLTLTFSAGAQGENKKGTPYFCWGS